MKTKFICAIAIALTGCGNQAENKNANNTDTLEMVSDTLLVKNQDAVDLETEDISFFTNAAFGGMVEVESGNKILTTTKDAAIKTYAAMMVADHGDANKQLAVLAQQKGYSLPSVLPQRKIDLISKMNALNDEAKNEYYLKLMLNEHQQAIDVFSLASRSEDQQIRQFAARLLPILEHHYRQTTSLDSLIRQPKANQGDDPLKISDRNKK